MSDLGVAFACAGGHDREYGGVENSVPSWHRQRFTFTFSAYCGALVDAAVDRVGYRYPAQVTLGFRRWLDGGIDGGHLGRHGRGSSVRGCRTNRLRRFDGRDIFAILLSGPIVNRRVQRMHIRAARPDEIIALRKHARPGCWPLVRNAADEWRRRRPTFAITIAMILRWEDEANTKVLFLMPPTDAEQAVERAQALAFG
jgi:hypothetical protein